MKDKVAEPGLQGEPVGEAMIRELAPLLAKRVADAEL